MNKKELSKYYYLTLEIKDLESKIIELESKLISSPTLTGMPHGNTISNPTEKTAILLATLKDKLENRRLRSITELNKIEDYISQISDVDIRLIFNKRYIQLKRWDEIASEMYMSERSVYRKHSDYFKENTHE